MTNYNLIFCVRLEREGGGRGWREGWRKGESMKICYVNIFRMPSP